MVFHAMHPTKARTMCGTRGGVYAVEGSSVTCTKCRLCQQTKRVGLKEMLLARMAEREQAA